MVLHAMVKIRMAKTWIRVRHRCTMLPFSYGVAEGSLSFDRMEGDVQTQTEERDVYARGRQREVFIICD